MAVFVHFHRVEMQHVQRLIVHQLQREKARKTKRKSEIKSLRQSVNTLTVRKLLDRSQKTADQPLGIDREALGPLQSEIGGLLKGLNQSMETAFRVMEDMKRESECNLDESAQLIQHFNFGEQDGPKTLRKQQGRIRRRYLKLLQKNVKQRRAYSHDLGSAISGTKTQHRVFKMRMGQMENVLNDLCRPPFRC